MSYTMGSVCAVFVGIAAVGGIIAGSRPPEAATPFGSEPPLERNELQPEPKAEPGTLHPAIANMAGVVDPTAKTIRFNGYQLPTKFTVRLAKVNQEKAFADVTMDFVLIEPGQYQLGPIRLHTERPFYMSRTEISIEQDAALYHEGYLLPSVDVYREMIVATCGPGMDQSDIDAMSEYLKRRSAPAVGLSAERAAQRALSIAQTFDADVRLPSLAEWYVAMASGRESGFWWGAEFDAAKATWSGTPVRGLPDLLKSIKGVTEGVASSNGLVHMIGNASEIVVPTERERALINAVFESKADRSSQGFCPVFAPHSWLAVGTTIRAGWQWTKDAEVAKQGPSADVLDLDSVASKQMHVNRTWGSLIQWPVTARFVVAIPKCAGEMP